MDFSFTTGLADDRGDNRKKGKGAKCSVMRFSSRDMEKIDCRIRTG